MGVAIDQERQCAQRMERPRGELRGGGFRHPAAIEMRAMAVELPSVQRHPNRMPFEGVLTLVDVASDRAPSGARGHRVA